jgi:MFS transporter, DHA1 family, tetracycline resistance protein
LKKPTVVIFITVFIYLLGFGMIIPVLPILSTHYGATPFQVGLLMSVFSLMQFLFSPFWGKLSDKYGRRPILIYCLLGEAISYLVLAQSKSIEMLFVARILTGFFGASISTASAYVSDITSREDRTKGMAIIGAAFGLGFLFGPAIGGGLTILAKRYSDDQGFILTFAAYPVALLCFLTFIFAYFFLVESVDRKQIGDEKATRKQLHNIVELLKKPILGPLMLVFGFTTLSMSMMESTLILFMKDKFNWGVTEASFGFAYVGICIVFTQGYLVRKLIPKFGEKVIIRAGLISMAFGFALIAIANNIWVMGLAMTFLSVGNAFTNPSVLGSISLITSADQQGVTLGTTQSLSALGRVIGPAFGTLLFGAISFSAPFWIGSLLLILNIFVVVKYYALLPASNVKTAS